MKLIILTSIFLISIPVFADDVQREIEYKAINLVIKKYEKGLSNRLKMNWFKPKLSKLV